MKVWKATLTRSLYHSTGILAGVKESSLACCRVVLRTGVLGRNKGGDASRPADSAKILGQKKSGLAFSA